MALAYESFQQTDELASRQRTCVIKVCWGSVILAL